VQHSGAQQTFRNVAARQFPVIDEDRGIIPR